MLAAEAHRARPRLAAYFGQRVVVGIRPEDLPTADGAGASSAVLKGDVVLVEALGAEQLVHFVIDARRVHVTDAEETDLLEEGVASQSGEGVARVEPRAVITSGEQVAFTLHPDRLHFFDTESQLSITSGG